MASVQACILLCGAAILASKCVLTGSTHLHQPKASTHHTSVVDVHTVDDLTYKDILDWTAKHSHSNSVLKHQMSLNGIKAKVLHSKLNQRPGFACAQRTIKSCDLRTMAQLLMLEDSPCTLLQEYQMCVDRESERCLSGEVIMLKRSLRHLVDGLQQQGHCAGITRKPEVTTGTSHVRTPRPCARKATWRCMTSFVEDLKSSLLTTCATITDFRHCLHMRSSSCGHDSTDLLIRGSRGLSRLYRRLTYQC